MENLKLAYFSPTGTTAKVIHEIARGMTPESPETLDLTSPQARTETLCSSAKELLILAVPVYMGRIPAILDGLNQLRLERTPVVCVVVYGNRAYEDALLELGAAVKKRGGIPVAGAAFIGEHSFSSPELPTAHARPDAQDLKQAYDFGCQIKAKLEQLSDNLEKQQVEFPGNRPYGGLTKLWDVDFISVDEKCTQCGLCAEICPANAISTEKSSSIDIVKCISCCACIKKCPANARSIKPGPVQDAAHRLNSLFNARKEPEIFI
ncbi:EFR1 family ferrodoxin [Desulfovibrio sp. JC010]|uniref:EFR1 family ferrodoxin n=1 Tax=Desulfovibrio sp. JC010 TaxID=2593641 RepID=UPI0019401A05|nr:EFR1 family ferrodoxin [Desulfovibrio sp. JC010]